MLALAEAAWASLLLGVLYNGPQRPHVDLPFLALALPAVAAVALGGSRGRWGRFVHFPRRWSGPASPGGSASSGPAPTSGIWTPFVNTGTRARRWSVPELLRRPGRWPLDLMVVGLVALVGMGLTAGLISELSIAHSFGRVAVRPWDTIGHRPAVVAGAAWFVAVLAWARGVWLGSVTLSARHTAWSLVVAGAVYLGIFAGRAADHTAAFRAASANSGWLFFITFPLAAAAIAMVHQRDLERQVLTRASSRPSGAWVVVLVAPMAAIAAVALLLAVLVGPAAPVVGRAIAAAATVAWTGISAAALFLWHLVPRGHTRGKLPTLPKTTNTVPSTKGHRPKPKPQHAFLTIPTIVDEVLGAIAVLALAAFLLRNVRFTRSRRPQVAEEAEEDRDSLFSWQHLLDQVRAALLRLLRRLIGLRPHRRRPAPAGVVVGAGTGTGPEEVAPRSVRDAYRRLLVAARQSGAARRPPETTQELERRLAGPLAGQGPDAAQRLRELTGLYEAVRYGSATGGDAEREQALADAEIVIPALRLALAPPDPEVGAAEVEAPR